MLPSSSRRRLRAAARLGGLAAAVLFTVAAAATPAGASTVHPATAVGGATVALSTSAAGADGVTYTVGFTTSPGGALARNQGKIVLTVPSGTKVTGTAQISDLTTGQTGAARAATAKTSGGVTTVTVTTDIAIGAANQVRLVLTGVNSATSAGTDTLSVTTTADTTADSAPFTLTAAAAVTQITPVTTTAAVAGSLESTFSLGFTTSATGALVPGYGTLRLIAGASTQFVPSSPTGPAPNITVADLTTGRNSGALPLTASEQVLGGNGTYLTVPAPFAVGAGDQLVLTIRGATHDNALNTPQSFTVSTSSDVATAQTPAFEQTPPTFPSAANLALGSTVAGATTTYTITFKASPQGALDPLQGCLLATFPSGTDFDPSGLTPTYTVTDLTTGQTGSYGAAGAIFGNGGATVTIPLYTAVSPGDTVQVVWNGVTNWSVAGPTGAMLTTSTDLIATQMLYTLTAS